MEIRRKMVIRNKLRNGMMSAGVSTFVGGDRKVKVVKWNNSQRCRRRVGEG